MNKTTLLNSGFELNEPATVDLVETVMREYQFTIPPSYIEFLHLSNGLSTDNFTLLKAEELFQRNKDYEIDVCLPQYMMIGDNNGGVAILMECKTGAIYANGLGSLLPEDLKFQAENLEEFLSSDSPFVNY